jgi:anthranilate synthase/aminodeoxychorismate synthase-like glutamine amidotransferase
MVFVLDNYDSFTYNLVQMIGGFSRDVVVMRNDAVSADVVRSMNPSAVVISPGPCTPAQAGISMQLVRTMKDTCPILGVCLGHQSIAAAFGGKVVRAGAPVHGKVSAVRHDGRTIFRDVPDGFAATRYHSLVVEEAGLPGCLEVSARTDDGVIMGVRHRSRPVEGIQFHPESVLTAEGKRILMNFLNLA